MYVRTRLGRLAPVAAATLLCAFGVASPAQAGPLVKSAQNCPSQALSQPFAPWLDPLFYTPVGGGSMEDGTPGWTLSGAKVAAGNETYFVRSKADTRSLILPRASSAQSRTICVGLDHLTLRFFVKSTAPLLSSILSTLKVEVLFEDAGGSVRSLPIALVPLSPRWSPTLPIPVVANLLPLLPGSQTAVAFRFTPQGPASWNIDDVYVDPKSRG
jgi:hypothetical protein